MTIKLICSDSNGVLNNVHQDYSRAGCGWWSSIINDDPKLYEKINNFVFGESKYLCNSWMCNEISSRDMNKILSDRFEVDENYLEKMSVESGKGLLLNWDLINIYQKQRKKGLKVVITTDNMDVFSLYTVPFNNLNDYFDDIFNSAELGHLKEYDDFRLYKKIAEDNGLKLSEILIVDDTKKLIDKAEKIGFSTYLYNQDTYMNFENVLNDLY